MQYFQLVPSRSYFLCTKHNSDAKGSTALLSVLAFFESFFLEMVVVNVMAVLEVPSKRQSRISGMESVERLCSEITEGSMKQCEEPLSSSVSSLEPL